jgi:hypothetical protein
VRVLRGLGPRFAVEGQQHHAEGVEAGDEHGGEPERVGHEEDRIVQPVDERLVEHLVLRPEAGEREDPR